MTDDERFAYFDVTATYTDESGKRFREVFIAEARSKAEARASIRDHLRDDKDVIINRIRMRGSKSWLQRLMERVSRYRKAAQ
jgi:hypothetical protein